MTPIPRLSRGSIYISPLAECARQTKSMKRLCVVGVVSCCESRVRERLLGNFEPREQEVALSLNRACT